jgi:protein-L-isoaspartate(D-aspartate) O-methyltransferase
VLLSCTSSSARNLASLIGENRTSLNGSVVSIDVDPEMPQRAARPVAAAGYANVTCITADGRAGWPQRAAYDRIIAWALPTL